MRKCRRKHVKLQGKNTLYGSANTGESAQSVQ